MLKLVYHTHVLGPIELEFDKALIRVGSGEDNDLVIPHPSVRPHHCVLVFDEDALFYLAPGQEASWHDARQPLAPSEFRLGDTLRIGDVQFSLQYSSQTVALPKPFVAGPGSLASSMVSSAPSDGRPEDQPYYCPHCRAFLGEAQLKRVGLVGHAKHKLCPKCGRAVLHRTS